MADYYSILNKTISGLKNNDIQMREAVYERARATIEKQLRGMDPVPSEDTIAAQLNALKEAASKLESEYLPPEPETVDIIPSSDDEVATNEAETASVSVDETGSEATSDTNEAHTEPEPETETETEPEPEPEVSQSPQTDASFIIAPAEPVSVTSADEPAVAAPEEPASVASIDKPAVETPKDTGSIGSGSDAFVIASAEPVSAAPIEKPVVEQPIVDVPAEPDVAAPAELIIEEEIEPEVVEEAVAPLEEPVTEIPADPIVEPMVEASAEIVDETISEPFIDPVLAASINETIDPVADEASTINISDEGSEVEAPSVIPSPGVEVSEPQTVDIAPAPNISLEQEVAQSVEPQADEMLDAQPVQSPTSDAIDAVAAAVEDDGNQQTGHVSVLDDQAAEPKKSRKLGCFLFLLVLLLALGGGGYGAWLNKDTLMEKAQSIFASFTSSSDQQQDDPTDDAGDGKNKEAVRIGENGEDASADPVDDTQEATGETKLAIDLAPEVNTGTEPETTQETEEVAKPEEPAEPEKPVIETVEEGEDKEEDTQPNPNSLGEEAYLYEVVTAGEGFIRVNGSVVWELKTYEKPVDGRAKNYILGKMEIPERDISIDFQIDHNLDEALTASHLIDIKFDLPEGFDGRGIDSVDRLTMKSSEGAAGEALIAVPYKYNNGHFLFALNNSPDAQKFNTQLLLSSVWVDFPVNYESGKRVLLVLEKGETGEQIFKEAFESWSQ